MSKLDFNKFEVSEKELEKIQGGKIRLPGGGPVGIAYRVAYASGYRGYGPQYPYNRAYNPVGFT
ncbi:hypothetical protein [Carnobacterium maltaromaticum]|uniref:hypothetical protein n=1 Tax=Carnobacterium maltaromaticum TaxID=2751 RepID=UPI0039BEC770